MGAGGGLIGCSVPLLVSATEGVAFVWRGGSALGVGLAYGRCRSCFSGCVPPCGRAYFLLLRQKKVAKEKATPGSAPGVARSLALLGRPGGLLNSPAAQTDASRMPPASLRCSAPLRGTRKASRNNGSAQKKTKRVFFSGRPLETGQNHFERFGGDAFPGPHVERRATELMADKGRGLSEARRAEFRSPRQQRVAQGSRRSRPRSLGSPFLWLLSFGEAKESMPARKAEPSRQTRTQIFRSRDEQRQSPENRYKTKVDRPEISQPTHELPAPGGGH